MAGLISILCVVGVVAIVMMPYVWVVRFVARGEKEAETGCGTIVLSAIGGNIVSGVLFKFVNLDPWTSLGVGYGVQAFVLAGMCNIRFWKALLVPILYYLILIVIFAGGLGTAWFFMSPQSRSEFQKGFEEARQRRAAQSNPAEEEPEIANAEPGPVAAPTNEVAVVTPPPVNPAPVQPVAPAGPRPLPTTFVCTHDIPAYSETDTFKQVGKFLKDSHLAVGAKDPKSGKYHVTYDDNGKKVSALVYPSDLGITLQDEEAAAAPATEAPPQAPEPAPQ